MENWIVIKQDWEYLDYNLVYVQYEFFIGYVNEDVKLIVGYIFGVQERDLDQSYKFWKVSIWMVF